MVHLPTAFNHIHGICVKTIQFMKFKLVTNALQYTDSAPLRQKLHVFCTATNLSSKPCQF